MNPNTAGTPTSFVTNQTDFHTLAVRLNPQELLRHANSRITLDLYAQAGMQEKREAQSKLVRLVLNKGETLA